MTNKGKGVMPSKDKSKSKGKGKGVAKDKHSSSRAPAPPSSRKLKTICVFGGNNFGQDAEFVRVATDLGLALAARNITMMYAGGSHTLCSIVARNVIYTGGRVMSVTHAGSTIPGSVHYTYGEVIQVALPQERLAVMMNIADAFVSLPGGLESLEAFSVLSSWGSCHNKPFGFLNINGFYDGLLAFLGTATEQGFITPGIKNLIISAPGIEQLLDQLQQFAPMALPPVSQTVDSAEPSRKRRRREPDTDRNEPDTELRL